MSTYSAAYEIYLQQYYGTLVNLFLVALSLVICWHIGPRVLRRWKHYEPVYLAWCGLVYIVLAAFPYLGAK